MDERGCDLFRLGLAIVGTARYMLRGMIQRWRRNSWVRRLPGIIPQTVRDHETKRIHADEDGRAASRPSRARDSYPPLQRVLQHLSWAPVIVDLEWK
jgi:hypothetical protein